MIKGGALRWLLTCLHVPPSHQGAADSQQLYEQTGHAARTPSSH